MDRELKLNRRTFLAGLGGVLTSLSLAELTPAAEVDQRGDQRQPTGRFDDIDKNTFFDVCIISSGFAGAILGDALVRHGIKTAILESGPDPRGESVDARF
jgi:hypothetical protein